MKTEFDTLMKAKAARRRRSRRGGDLHLIWQLPEGGYTVRPFGVKPGEGWTLIEDVRTR